MKIQNDFKEFIASLNKHNVRYLIVGGYAFAFHAEPRFTKDIDFFIDRSEENAECLIKALADFGFGDIGLTKKDFIKPGEVVQLGFAPVRIDLTTSVTGVEFAPAWDARVKGDFGGEPAYFISKEDLIRNKSALGRKQDLSDVEKLQQI